MRVLPVRKVRKNNGFSLTEVLFAVATLAIAMLFIAGTFPVAIYFSTIATERTIAAVAADEAFAKIRLYAVGNPNDSNDDINLNALKFDQHTDFNNVTFPATFGIDPNEFAYPSDRRINISEKKYYWSALCRRVDLTTELVQVTVFVSRKIGSGTMYIGGQNRPVPVPVEVEVYGTPGSDELFIKVANPANPVEKTFINDGYTIVDNQTGQIYRVLERYAGVPPIDQVIKLDRPWQGGPTGLVWVVPPPVNGGRYPCIAVYQKVIRF